MNPNQRSGICVSIYDCQTILSVLERSSVQDIDTDFVKASRCSNGYRNLVEVCCTADTGFTRTRQQFNDNGYFWESPGITSFYPTNRPIIGTSNNSKRVTRPTNQQQNQRDIQNSDLLPKSPSCGGITIAAKIFGGKDSELYEFPWMVLLEYDRSKFHF